MANPVSIVVDDREARSGVLDVLAVIDDVKVKVKRLTVGDFEVNNTLLVERKTLTDFAVSIKDGRLFSQAIRLASQPSPCLYILEGRSDALKATRMSREALQGALITLSLYLGIPVLRALNLEETVKLMRYAAGQNARIASGGVPRKGRRARAKHRAQLYMLQGLPGVGPERAMALLERFGSVDAVVSASTEALEEVQGIGSHIAASIRWVVKESPPAYKHTVSHVFSEENGFTDVRIDYC